MLVKMSHLKSPIVESICPVHYHARQIFSISKEVTLLTNLIATRVIKLGQDPMNQKVNISSFFSQLGTRGSNMEETKLFNILLVRMSFHN